MHVERGSGFDCSRWISPTRGSGCGRKIQACVRNVDFAVLPVWYSEPGNLVLMQVVGTGFLVTPDGYFVTAGHVLKEYDRKSAEMTVGLRQRSGDIIGQRVRFGRNGCASRFGALQDRRLVGENPREQTTRHGKTRSVFAGFNCRTGYRRVHCYCWFSTRLMESCHSVRSCCCH